MLLGHTRPENGTKRGRRVQGESGKTNDHRMFEGVTARIPEPASCSLSTEDRIALEMKLKLGIEHAASTVSKYMVDDGGPGGMTWGTFLRHCAGAVLAEAGAAGARWRGLWNLCLATAVVASQQQVARTATGIWRAPAGLISRPLAVLPRSRPRWRQQPDQRQVSGQEEGEEPATSTGRSRPQVDLVSAPALAWGSRWSPRAPPESRPSDVTQPHLDDVAHEYELAA